VYPGTHASTNPDKPAVIMAPSGRVTSYAELEDRSLRLAHLLHDAGLSEGDHVALLSDNSPEALEVYWAVMRTGMYLTAINWHLSAGEAGYILEDCEATALVASASVDTAAAVLADAKGIDLALAFGGEVDGYGVYEEALAEASTAPLGDQPRGTDMLYSSGTTGRPKGIKGNLPGIQVDEAGDVFTGFLSQVFGFGEDSVYLSPAPIYHAAPLRFCGTVTAMGGTVVMMERFDAQAAITLIDEHGVTHSQWVPTMFVRMLKLPDEAREVYDGSTHRVAIHAAAPCPPDVKKAMIDWWGPILWEYYSSTEGNGITVINSEQWRDHEGSVGKALLGTAHVCDDAGKELAPREIGTIWFERDERPFTYHNDEEKTREATHPGHPTWTTTGDIGYLDEEGFVYLTDRKAFMIISGGVNIYPQEIEDQLALHPKVADVAVIGIPHPEWGEEVKAVVQPAADAQPGDELADEILEFLRGRIAGYKMPRSVDFIGELPRTPTGKLVKGQLRDRYVEEQKASG
jgi:long-chain acyl-CoA synthetase